MRCRSLDDTLSFARAAAEKYGISRVTQTTWLDRIGLPVYASVRPVAMEGSLCVNAGKGLNPKEAEVGAYMEAIEYAVSEPNRAGLEIINTSADQLLDGSTRPGAVLDFCPVLGAKIEGHSPVEAVKALDLISGATFLVPAALAFLPYATPKGYPSFFAHGSNGLASGNSRVEASIHGIFEIMERDITAFQTVNNTTRLVYNFPPKVQAVIDQIQNADLEIKVRYGTHELEIPWFVSYVYDPEHPDPIFLTGGFGCHPDREIAMMRSITETLQGRLTIIHGSRDDLYKVHDPYTGWEPALKKSYFNQVVASFSGAENPLDAATLPNLTLNGEELEPILESLLAHLRSKGFNFVLQVPLTQPDNPLQVVKMIIPRMESFAPANKVIGQRLRDYAAQLTDNPVRGSQPE